MTLWFCECMQYILDPIMSVRKTCVVRGLNYETRIGVYNNSAIGVYNNSAIGVYNYSAMKHGSECIITPQYFRKYNYVSVTIR